MGQLLKQLRQSEDRVRPARTEVAHFKKTLPVEMKNVIDTVTAQYFLRRSASDYGGQGSHMNTVVTRHG
jgi:hypothetical protein